MSPVTLGGRAVAASAPGPDADAFSAPIPGWDGGVERAIGAVWGCLMRLTDAAADARRTREARDRLLAKLDDPALRDHPKRAEAWGREVALAARLTAAARDRESAMAGLGHAWRAAPAKARKRLAEEGWPTTTDPDAVAAWAWASVSAWPPGRAGPDVPF